MCFADTGADIDQHFTSENLHNCGNRDAVRV